MDAYQFWIELSIYPKLHEGGPYSISLILDGLRLANVINFVTNFLVIMCAEYECMMKRLKLKVARD